MKRRILTVTLALVYMSIATLYMSCTPTTAKGFEKRGFKYYEKGELDKAIADYTEAIRLDSDYSDVYLFRGQAYSKKGSQQKAIDDFTNVIRLKPDSDFFLSHAYYERALIYDEKGDYNNAIEDYNEYLLNNYKYKLKDGDVQNKLADAKYKRALIYDEKGDYNNAIEDYNEYLNYKPKDEDVQNKLSYAKYKQAVAEYTEAIRLNPKNADAYYKRGLEYRMQIPTGYGGSIAGSIQKFFYDPHNYESEWNMVISDCEAALKINPNHVEAKRLLEKARTDLGY